MVFYVQCNFFLHEEGVWIDYRTEGHTLFSIDTQKVANENKFDFVYTSSTFRLKLWLWLILEHISMFFFLLVTNLGIKELLNPTDDHLLLEN